MNERIKQLADKAGQLQLATPDNPSADAIMVLIGPNIEKFAELIVKECVETISSHMSRHVTGAVRNNGFNLGLATARESIEEHFGVEE